MTCVFGYQLSGCSNIKQSEDKTWVVDWISMGSTSSYVVNYLVLEHARWVLCNQNGSRWLIVVSGAFSSSKYSNCLFGLRTVKRLKQSKYSAVYEVSSFTSRICKTALLFVLSISARKGRTYKCSSRVILYLYSIWVVKSLRTNWKVAKKREKGIQGLEWKDETGDAARKSSSVKV